MDTVTPAPSTQPRGALSPNLAEQLDRLADQGRSDRLLAELGLKNDAQQQEQGDQLSLFDLSEDGTTFVSFEGETL